jgi:hypothetical protein
VLRGLSLLRNGKPYERHENEPHPIPSHLFSHRLCMHDLGNVRATATGREPVQAAGVQKTGGVSPAG